MTRLARRLWALRAGALTLALLTVVIAVAQLGGGIGLPALREPASFAIAPLGQDVPRLAPITITFAKPPAEREPQRLFTVEPATLGTYAWLSARTVLFQPDFPGLLRGSTYTVTVPPRPDAGLPTAVSKKFTVTGALTVQQLIPGDGDTEVPLGSPIIVQFSRSVAPLTTLAAQRADRVLEIDPPLAGKGEWLNTSIYRFVPSDLQPSTTYRLRIPKGLTAAADGVLAQDVSATFTTISPAIAFTSPDDNSLFASPRQDVGVRFNQPMDPSAIAGIRVLGPAGAEVPGTKSWEDGGTRAVFTPSVRLEPRTRYTVSIAPGLKGARGGQTAQGRTTSFTTIPLPSVLSTNPPGGSINAGRFGVSLSFATPMDPETLEGRLRVSGFSAEELEGRVSASEQYLSANVPLKARTSYTVELLPGATDRYGQVMGGHRFFFTTGAVPSSVSLALPGYTSAVTYSASTDPILYFQATNVDAVRFTLYPLTPDEGRNVLHDPGRTLFGPQKFTPSLAPRRTWTEPVKGAIDDVVLGTTSLGGGAPLPRGYYLVETGGAMSSRFAFAVVDTVIVAKIAQRELVAWAVDHDTGRPVAGATVRATGPGISPEQAVTDENGLASFDVPALTPAASFDRSYVLWIDADGRSAIASTRWQQGLSAYQFGLPSEYYSREWVGHLYSDRPLYRPGETVELKGVVRADDDADYSIPPSGAQFELVITNPRGQQAVRQDVALNDFGTFAASFQLPGDAPLGTYSLSTRVKGSQYQYVASGAFVIAEFRSPEFKVEVATARPSYVDGDTIEASATASFFFGGALAGSAVQWSALASPYTLRVKGLERYAFADLDQYQRPSVYKDPVRAKGRATTSAAGVATFAVPATLQPSEGAQRFTVSATVTDENGQAVAASTSVTVHPSSFYAGVRPAQYVATEGRDAVIELVTVDTEGALAPGRAVTVKVYDRQWITVKEQIPGGGRRYKSEPKDTLIATRGATTGADGKATVTVRPAKPGTLRIVAEAADDGGRVGRSAAYLWVSGSGFATWQVTNDDAIKLVADKDRYEVGDTAEILVPAPFAGATGLVTIERGKVMSRDVREFTTNSERLRIAITDTSVPNVFVSVVLYRAPTRADPLPRFKLGYVQLPVSTATRALNVSVKPDRAQAKPGDTVKYDVKVTDAAGRGVRSEVSVAVVDRAVLSLQDEIGPDGLHAFWFERGLGVSTASSMAVSVDRWNDAVVEAQRAGKGGSGSGSGQTPDGARQEFRNTAFWTAQLATDDQGAATFEARMPDNLTTWRAQVRAVGGDTMVGEGTSELVSALPLMVRSALPRFLRAGDAADLRVLVRNSSPAASEVKVTLRAEGVTVTGDLARTVTVRSGSSAIVSWPAKVQGEGTAKLSFTASGTGGLADALSVQLPVLLDVTPETMATGGIVSGEGALEAIYLPPFASTAHGSLNVQVRSALVGSMADSLRDFALRKLGEEGAERVSSRLIASLGVRRAEKSAGGAASVSDGAIASDLAGIIGRQRPDGGWAWCDRPYCESDPNVTGWALLALGEARRDGLAIDAGVVQRANAYLFAYLDRPHDVLSPGDPSQKAFLLAALASAGATTALTPARALFEQYRTRLTASGRAYLLLALADAGVRADDPQVRTLLDELAAATIPSANGNHWEDETPSGGTFVTSTGATGLGILALARAQPQHALLAQTVRWMVVARSSDGWRTSIDHALGVLALTTFAVASGELGGDYAYRVALDDDQVLAGIVKKGAGPVAASRDVPLTALAPGKTSILALTRDRAGSGRLYYTLDLRYVTPAKEVEAVNRGFAVTHEYTLLDDPSRPVTGVKVGETVRVKVTVLAPADRSYVVVEDPLPAGFEAVDARLKTVDPALRARLDADRARSAQQRAGGYAAPWYGWYYSPWQQVELRDDRAVLYASRLPRGVYEHVYYVRATTPGDFFVAPARAEETYFPEVFGRSDSGRFIVYP